MIRQPSTRDFFEKLFPNGSEERSKWRSFLIECCEQYLQSGLADPHYFRELTETKCGNLLDSDFWPRISEAFIYRLLISSLPKNSGYSLNRKKRSKGPDFLLCAPQKQKLWIEVICPQPKNVPEIWLSSPNFKAYELPNDDILSRWTSAIWNKAKKFREYLEQGVISSENLCVIAVNGVRMRNRGFPAFTGLSLFPFAVEALYGVGPLALRWDDHRQTSITEISYRDNILKEKNSSKIPTTGFLDTSYAHISAIWALDFNGTSVLGYSDPSAVIHNPYARQKLSLGVLPANQEYSLTERHNHWEIQSHPGTISNVPFQ